MNITIKTQGFDLTDGLREHTERRLRFALSWLEADLQKVVVSLSDINGPRGGNDKRCQIHVPLPRARPIVIEDTESDLYRAIDRAAERAERTLARRVARLREHPRGRMNYRDRETEATASPVVQH